MAAQFFVGRQISDIQVTQYGVVKVERITATTIPSGVTFEVLVPVAAWASQGSASWIAPTAQEIEYLMSSGEVAGIAFVEDVDDVTGLLSFFFDLTVQVPSPSPTQPGPMEAVVRVPAAAFAERLLIDAEVIPAIDAARATLAATASL